MSNDRCEQPGIYVLDTTELAWKTSFTAGTVYTTPDNDDIVAVTGGRGTGTSTSGSGYAIGTGANDPDTSSQFPDKGSSGGSGKDNNNGGNKGSSNNAGAIAGGVVGGLIGAALIAALAWYLLVYRKKKRLEAETKEKIAFGSSGGSSHHASPGSLVSGNPYDDPSLAQAASDDVEEAMAGYNAQFRWATCQAGC